MYAKDGRPMKITCQSCQAKYTIADEKVLGKIVKIRCKKCSSTIVVNGADASGAPQYGDSGEAGGQLGGGGGGGDEGWMVNVAEGDQRTMSDADVIAAFQAGVIGAETYCWKDGMSDWLPLKDIDALFDACQATRMVQQAAPEPVRAVARGGRAASAVPLTAGAASDYGASNGSNGGGAPAAARRAGGRAPAADLFHGVAQAGGEEEVMTSAPVGAPQAYDEQKPAVATTGARNENSVLFSLSALTSKGTDRPPAVPGAEASGLIDIRQLSAQMGRGDDKKRSRVDDIMNLSSGGAFNGALNAPVMSAPAIDQYGPSAGASMAPPEKSKGVIFLAIGAAALVVIAAVGATFMLTHKTDADSAAASASAAGTEAPSAPVAAATTTATAAATASAAAPDTSASAAPTETAAATAAATTAAAATPTAAPAPVAPPVAQAPRPQPVAPRPVAAAPAPAAAPEGAEFNMGEAKSKLAAAAAAAQGCKKGDGPTGTGRVVVVFTPGGGAQSATISGPPFEGTPTGACVAARFRGVRVPAFSGSPFSVSKSFTIN
jgi:predicted Zn finger-like uncharacterized protein